MKHNKITGYVSVIVAGVFAATLIVHAQQQQPSPPTPHEHNGTHSSCPMMRAAELPKESAEAVPHQADGMAEMNMRGEREMGFSQTQTTHHFRLLKDGGAIEIEVNETKDTAMRDQVRQHLKEIAQAFSGGDFATPLAVHAQIPPGVPVMKRLKAAIKYEYEETAGGGRVRISTDNSEALSAIHAFLRFQIEEHRTGDPLE
ncbi:MAG TPA: hypothetical protein VE842_17790 [Pyrinomonadaceae bacterium]|jgi:hypothetical protein|nr:hypothetical protein [Pyrinomonadaceae bacterium]